MNKRYIDFVPAKKASGTSGTSGAASRAKTSVKVSGASKAAPKRVLPKAAPRKVAASKVAPRMTREIPKPTAGGERKRTVRRAARTDEPKLGVIEDLAGDFVSSSTVPKQPVKKEAYSIPKTPFINQNSVVKRPLSKNVYQKKQNHNLK